jgi:hypothetical protein
MGACLRRWLGVLVAAILLDLFVMHTARAEDDVPPKWALVAALQKAIGADDKEWLAAHLHLPVHYYRAKTQVIRNRAWLLKHYATVIGPKLKAAVLAQDPKQVFENWQGLMVGDGSRNIWVRSFGPDLEPKHEIITINDSGP